MQSCNILKYILLHFLCMVLWAKWAKANWANSPCGLMIIGRKMGKSLVNWGKSRNFADVIGSPQVIKWEQSAIL